MKQAIQSQVENHTGPMAPGSMRNFTVEHECHSGPIPVERNVKARPLKVLHVIDSLGLGGTEQGVLKVMAGLDPESFEQRICAIRSIDRNLAQSGNVAQKVFTAGQDRPGFQFLVPRLVREIRAYQPHIVHSRNWGAIEAIPAGWLAHIPVVIHSEHGYEMDMLSGLPLRRRLLRRALYSMCDAVFTVSNELREYHGRQSWFSERKIRVIPNGVDTDRFGPDLERRERTRRSLGLPSEGLIVGTIGRMVPIKDQRALLAAARNLIERGYKPQVLLIGGGSERNNLREQAQASTSLRECVRFLDPSLEVPDLLRALDIFVLPSISEGMSNTLLEAMASGTACVATSVGGNPELVEDGRSGLLFTPKDVTALTEHLARLILQPDLRIKLALAARERAVTQFSLERMMDNYSSLYLEMARKGGVLPGA